MLSNNNNNSNFPYSFWEISSWGAGSFENYFGLSGKTFKGHSQWLAPTTILLLLRMFKPNIYKISVWSPNVPKTFFFSWSLFPFGLFEKILSEFPLTPSNKRQMFFQ